ncbi:hypothetical protein F511_06916 [Dorcoceras hygrometricum]|uniref:Uncharacterized protein n=1 Tax=Dorcoceras hygrometricum TaxID=472368 RepID=A0A2Z7B833_9LAMI|nr:hypothetical protein F511_06916 [Dorcoceras hygrometricum]
MTASSDDEFGEKHSAVETVVVEQRATTSADDVDTIIEEVIAATAQMEPANFVESAVAGEIDLLQQIPGDALLPSVLAAEPTRINFTNVISIPGVAEGDLYKARLPKIALVDKGKAPLIEAGVVKGHPAQEMVQLIFGDIEFLIQLREQVKDEVSAFLNSFSLRRLPVLAFLKDITVKEGKVLTWAETDSVQIALQRRLYIVAKYRELLLRKFLESHRAHFSFGQPWSSMALQIIDLLSIAHNAAVNDLLIQRKAHALQWTRPCCSIFFEGVYERGFYIPRNHKIIFSTCWIRLVQFVGGSWLVEAGYDRLVYECETPVSQLWEKLPEQIELNSLAPICLFLEPVQSFSSLSLPPVKSWGCHRVCIELLQFSLIGGLRSVTAINRCRDIIGPLVDIEIIPTGFRGLFQRGLNANSFTTFLGDCVNSLSVQISPIVDITSAPADFVLSSPYQSSSSASSMHFTDEIIQGTETAVEQIPEPSTAPTATTFIESFAQLRDSISQISIKQVRTQRSLDDLKSELLFKIDNLAKASAEARDQQTQYFQNSLKNARQEARTQSDVLSVKLNEFHKGTRAHRALVTELEDIRKEVKAMDGQLATIQSEMLDFRAQAQENHLNLSTQLGFLVDYINWGGDAKKGEGGSNRPQPPHDDQRRPSGGIGSRGSGGDGSSQRRDRGGSSKKRHSSSSGGVHHRSGGGGLVGPIRWDAEYWICGKRQF